MTTTSADATILEGSGGRRWRVRGAADLLAFAGAPWPALVSTLLSHRDVHDTAEGHAYLGEPGELTDPRLMPNLEVAVERLARACTAGERVAVFGDFDVDGVTSTTILTEGLSALGAVPLPYIPDRFTEGYGPNVAAIEALHARGATVLVTADCGTSAVHEVAAANALGMDVIVIDHHTVPDELPEALAIVNPKLNGSEYGSEPAACGVAYKVVHDLHDRLGVAYDPAPHRALVALGTVCDLAPMLAENRDLVRIGMDALRTSKRPGLLALADSAGIELRDVDAEACGWVLGPRINAAGRMEHARIALDMMLATTEEEARPLAARLASLNEQRRDQTAAAFELAGSALTHEQGEAALVFVASEAISSGIVGLVASRLADQHQRPAIVAQIAGDEARASCRSIPEFDITALLRRNAGLFKRFGGHRAAAGFTIDASRLDEVRAVLLADAALHLDASSIVPTIDIDAELPLRDVNTEVLKWLGRLGPHGIGNATPTFLSRGVTVIDTRIVGKNGTHLQFKLREGRVTWSAIAFGAAERAVPAGEAADVVYTFRRDSLRGTLQLEVLDLRPAQ
ncbi:MAG: single-stranded-DNA-specific exonuclease RecJ [Chloroflexi bacterium]|nr:MAG: single-stranded-DNA-specific exonuclease RecJ [Chloroflexota bacterium]